MVGLNRVMGSQPSPLYFMDFPKIKKQEEFIY
jgi:hypothetical protein